METVCHAYHAMTFVKDSYMWESTTEPRLVQLAAQCCHGTGLMPSQDRAPAYVHVMWQILASCRYEGASCHWSPSPHLDPLHAGGAPNDDVVERVHSR